VPENAIINRMGFPSKGGRFIARRLAGGSRPPGLVLGVNIGKNKDTELEDAIQDYTILLRLLGPLADYLAINVSSPNTAGLRRLQGRDALAELMLAERRRCRRKTTACTCRYFKSH
jgi:dihydroorotate dehydrogenase